MLSIIRDPEESRIMLNIGGIANFTYLPASGSAKKVQCTDTGPGNTMLDAFARKYFGRSCDRDAAIGRSGKINKKLLDALMDHPFFNQPLPKTTGPELFNLKYLADKMTTAGLTGLAQNDTMATLHAFSIQSIIQSLQSCLGESVPLYVSGGGAHNPLLMELLRTSLPGCTIKTTGALGIDPDAKEAVLFIVLANECLFGNPGNYPPLESIYPRTNMGKISFP